MMYVPLLLLVGSVAIRATQLTEFCGVGYNLLKANPDAVNEGGVDPGYLPTRKVFALDNPSQQIETVARHSCLSHTSISMIYDEHSYQKKFDLSVGVEIGVEATLYSARFGLSTGFKEAKRQTTTSQEIRIDESTVCNKGRGRLKLALAPFGKLQVSDEFAAVVCALPTSYDKTQYMNFLDRWGTHVTIETDVGVRETLMKTSSKTSFFQAVTSQTNIASSVSGSYKIVSGSIEINMNKMRADQTFSKNFGEKTVKRTVGSKKLPEPIAVKLMTMDSVMDPKYWSKRFSSSICQGNVKEKLPVLRKNIKDALKGYASYKGVTVGPPIDELKMKITWPKGTYGFIAPQSGCLSGWETGYRVFDTEDSDNENRFENEIFLGGFFNKRHIKLEFCMKTYTQKSPLDMKWPVGNYCILKYRSCPQGLSEGFIQWDDEDSDNENTVGGYYPDGVYGKNTKIEFCCRSDGNPATPIVLPTGTPFVLMQASRYGCQKVAKAKATPVTVVFDTDDSGTNLNSKGGKHPYQPMSGNIKLTFCRYDAIP